MTMVCCSIEWSASLMMVGRSGLSRLSGHSDQVHPEYPQSAQRVGVEAGKFHTENRKWVVPEFKTCQRIRYRHVTQIGAR